MTQQFVFQQVLCFPINSLGCPDSYFANDSNVCEECISNCTECSADEGCDECENGYMKKIALSNDVTCILDGKKQWEIMRE